MILNVTLLRILRERKGYILGERDCYQCYPDGHTGRMRGHEAEYAQFLTPVAAFLLGAETDISTNLIFTRCMYFYGIFLSF